MGTDSADQVNPLFELTRTLPAPPTATHVAGARHATASSAAGGTVEALAGRSDRATIEGNEAATVMISITVRPTGPRLGRRPYVRSVDDTGWIVAGVILPVASGLWTTSMDGCIGPTFSASHASKCWDCQATFARLSACRRFHQPILAFFVAEDGPLQREVATRGRSDGQLRSLLRR